MRILMLSWRGPTHPKAGGAEIYTEKILEGLIERGHDVEWYSASYSKSMPNSYKGMTLTYGASGMKIYASGYFYAKKKQEIDIVIDQINVFGFLTPLIKKKSVVLIHQLAANVWEAEVKQPVSWIGKGLEHSMLQLYKQSPYITVSPSTDEDLRQIGWKGSSTIVTNGIEISSKKYEKTEHPVLVFLARFGAKAKRLDHAVKIFDKIREVFPNAEFWVIGRGNPPDWLADYKQVKVFQNASNEQRDELIGSAWCCLATSVREGWGRMVLESAMFETPSVVYNVHGLRDAVVDGKTGYIVEEDISDAANCIINLFRQPEKVKQLGKKAREHATSFTWERSITQFEQTLVNLIK